MPAKPHEHGDRPGLESTRIYEDLRRLASAQMRNQPASHTLTATALVHEAYIKLHGRDDPDSTHHLMGLAARAMRSILVDHARRKGRDKRTAQGSRVPIERLLGTTAARSTRWPSTITSRSSNASTPTSPSWWS